MRHQDDQKRQREIQFKNLKKYKALMLTCDKQKPVLESSRGKAVMKISSFVTKRFAISNTRQFSIGLGFGN